MTNPLSFLVALSVSMLGLVQAATLPTDFSVLGGAEEPGGWLVAGEEGISLSGAFSATSTMVFKGRTGKGGIAIGLVNGAGKTAPILSLQATDRKIPLMRGYSVLGDATYADNDLTLTWQGAGRGATRYSVRPNPWLYKPDEQEKRKATWASQPGASQHEFTLELKPASANSFGVWLEGQYLNDLPMPEDLENYGTYQIKLTNGAAVHSLQLKAVPESSTLALPVCLHSRVQGMVNMRIPGSFLPNPVTEAVDLRGMVNAQIQFDKGAPLPVDFKSLAGTPAKGIAVGGLGKIEGCNYVDLQSLFWTRNALDNLPEQRIFSVPLATFDEAEILCALDDDPRLANTFTLRLTRYGRTRGEAMADMIVTVPRQGGDKNASRVGSVTYGPEGARKTVALWLIKVPIKTGVIYDLIHKDKTKSREMPTSRTLDVELLDPLQNVDEAQAFPPSLAPLGRQWAPVGREPTSNDFYELDSPISPVSGVTVFGLLLKESPAAMDLTTNIGVQAFYASDNPEFIATIQAREAGGYTVAWEFADVDGKILQTGTRPAEIKAGEEGKVSIPVQVPNGWYAARVALRDKVGKTHVENQTSFVMLPPDTRKAGFESPFYGWWFGPAHNADARLEEIGPLFQRMGIRRVGLDETMPESLTAKYGITESHIAWNASNGPKQALDSFRDGKQSLPDALAVLEKTISAHLEKWPHLDRMLVFHESGPKGAPFPSELWGEPAKGTGVAGENTPEALLQRENNNPQAAAPQTKEQQEYAKHWPRRMEYLKAMATMVREKFPGLKLQFGNDGDSLQTMGEVFRQKFPKELMNTIAVEDLGQTFPPEYVRVGGLHSAWFLRELARKTGYGDVPVTATTEWIGRMVERLGLRQQAEWKARDGLLALAYGFDTISIAGLNDSGTGYYFSGWGNGGVCGRYPILAPRPAYAAIATLTQVFDQAKFQRFVPTSSTVTYVQEFRRGDEWVYAIWTPRGTREVSLAFPDDQSRSLIDLYGRETKASGKTIPLMASTAPRYVVSPTELSTATPGASAFPGSEAPAKPETVIPLDSLDVIAIVSDKKIENDSKKQPENIPQKREGNFILKEVEDPEMGKCLELELLPQNPLRWTMEHEYVVLRLKISVPTTAKNAGVWVKGNGSWGTVNILKSQQHGPWATTNNRHFNWRALAAMNFDGWNFIRYPETDWLRENKNEVLGLVIDMPRNAVVGTEMTPVKSLKIRLKSIVLY